MLRILETDLAIDVGTANTVIFSARNGMLLNEPSVIALNKEERRHTLIAAGSEAKRMIGRTPPEVCIVRPVRTGVVAELEATADMLRGFLRKTRTRRFRLRKPRVIVGVPCSASEVERRAIREAVSIFASQVTLIDEALAAAIGAGLPVNDARGSMIVDIGGGTSDIAVISLGAVVASHSVPIAGHVLDEAIIEHLRRNRQLRIGEASAELLKITIGSCHPQYDGQEMKVAGQDVATGLPRDIVVSSAELRQAFEPHVAALISGVRQTLENAAPELMSDILEDGIVLTGGGAFLKGLDKRITEQLHLKTHVPPNALSAVAEGASIWLQQKKAARGRFGFFRRESARHTLLGC